MPQTDVLSAFLDNEPFDARDLAAVLSEPEGRDTLMALMALRHVVQPDDDVDVMTPRPAARPMTMWLRAAAVFLAIGAGYAIGTARWPKAIDSSAPPAAVSATTDEPAPPSPTVVVKAAADAQWEPVRTGG